MTDFADMYYDVDITNFVYKEPKRNTNGGMNQFLDDKEGSKRNPKFQLEECIAKFGVSDPQEGSVSTRRNMELSVASKKMQDFIQALDAQNIAEIARNSKLHFKKDLDATMVSTLYRDSLQMHDVYDPLLRIKIATQGKNKTRILKIIKEKNPDTGELSEYSDDGTIDDITPWSKVVPIVQVGGLWFVSRGCGMTLIASDIMVWPEAPKRRADFVGYNIPHKKPRLTVEPPANAGAAKVTEDEYGGEKDYEDDVM